MIKTPLWDWDAKTADFIKPGDIVLDIDDDTAFPLFFDDGSVNVVLARQVNCDYSEAHRVLKQGGYFLIETVGSDSMRKLAEFLAPGSREAGNNNLENQLSAFSDTGFRVMYKNQSYPKIRFSSFEEIEKYIAENPRLFPNYSKENSAQRAEALKAEISQNGYIECEEHIYLLIGKKK